MKSLNSVLALLLLLFSPALRAQAPVVEKPKTYLNTLTLVGGAGYVHYFNDLYNLPEGAKVYNNRYVLSAKLYWEPAYRVKLGLETGFYSLYKTKGVYYDDAGQNPETVKTYLNVIPIFITVSTRIYGQLYLNVGTGVSCMIYGTDGLDNKVASAQFSLENLVVSLSYYFPVNQNLKLGAEAGYMNIGKTADNLMTAQVSLMYNLYRW